MMKNGRQQTVFVESDPAKAEPKNICEGLEEKDWNNGGSKKLKLNRNT